MKPEVPPEQRTGPSECPQSGGTFDHDFTQTPLAKHASFSGSLVAEVSSLCISNVCLITLDFPQPNRGCFGAFSTPLLHRAAQLEKAS